MGQLPSQRVVPSPPFQVTGIDYAGPFTVKKGHTRKPVLIKCYLFLFVCFTTKAVHIEVIEDLSTEDFIAGLKRFVARRGLPTEIHTDNGKNFIGAKNDLYQLYRFFQSATTQLSISTYLLSQRIQWKCIPECSPHFGGLWEAAVKSAKHHLRRIAGPICFTLSELSTVTCQIEACLNSRPLTVINSHSTDGISTLTPGHYLIGRPLTAFLETIIEQEPSKLKRRSMCQSVIHHFWKRWATEYLQQLQSLAKWRRASPNFQVSDIVVLRDDTAFICHWPLAQVVKTYPGEDNLVRTVLLKLVHLTTPKPYSKDALIRDKVNVTTPRDLLPRLL